MNIEIAFLPAEFLMPLSAAALEKLPAPINCDFGFSVTMQSSSASGWKNAMVREAFLTMKLRRPQVRDSVWRTTAFSP